MDALRSALEGRYDLGEELGRGATATVFVATDLRHGRRVALKVLNPDLAATIGETRFTREIELVASLHHPHILPLYDSGAADGWLYFVMPVADGDTLADRLRRDGRLPIEEAVQIARGVAEALSFAHDRGIVHRDIKPANILLTAGHAIVSDFGIARVADDADPGRLTRTGLGIGTPLYMSPEQSSGEADARSDQYGLGCVLFEMLTGRPPFEGATLGQILAMHASEPVPSTRAVRPEVSVPLDAAIRRALSKTPAERFASTREFAAAIGTALPSRAADAVVGTRRRRTRLIVAAAATIAVVQFTWSAWIANRERATRATLADVATLTASGDFVGAWELATRAARDLPDTALANVWPTFSRWTRATSTPPGATVWWSPLDPAHEWQLLGTAPTDSFRLPRGGIRWKAFLAGYDTAFRAATIDHSRTDATLVKPFELVAAGTTPPGMVLVNVQTLGFGLFGFDNSVTFPASPYFIDRTEVTNRAYRDFVNAGGYTDARWWTEPFREGERELTFEQAMDRFRDRTGRPGPATWEGGTYAAGEDDHPVGGLSWYEAAAFAKFAGKQLPTVWHWTSAIDRWMSAVLVPLSNIGGVRSGPLPAGSAGFGPWGTYDMVGNVGEWTMNATGSSRFLLGGAWTDAPYMFYEPDIRAPFDRSAGNGFRLALYPAGQDSLLDVLEAPIALKTFDLGAITPATDEVFAAYRARYAYDAAELHAEVVSIDDSAEHWRREKITFDAAYPGDRVALQLYIPRGVTWPAQTVVYWPSSYAILAANSDAPGMLHIEYLVKSGRIVALPVYKGTFERNNGLRTWVPDESTFYTETIIDAVRDARRTIDYLMTRPEVDTARIAFLGTSWGGFIGTIPLGVEPRFRTGILIGGGFPSVPARPEVSEFNFAPRVRVPLLMINGRHDFLFPYEASQVHMFRLIGTPPEQKRHIVYNAHHDVTSVMPANVRSDVLAWLDQQFGRVR